MKRMMSISIFRSELGHPYGRIQAPQCRAELEARAVRARQIDDFDQANGRVVADRVCAGGECTLMPIAHD